MRRYFKDEKGNTYSIIDVRHVGSGWTEINETEFKEINKKYAVPFDAKIARMKELKKLLADNDYKTSKIADGNYTTAERQLIKAQRNAWRAEYNALEKGGDIDDIDTDL